ncbi:uncharacterized protein TNCV_4531281 [Trichonephila clavipes]|nr:uncharacterized protein TNCV_4531281 [Trichonephila clavipes]
MYSAFVAGGTLYSRRAASPIVRLMEGEERWKVPDHSQGVLTPYWGETEQNHTVICMVLTAKANDRRKILALSRNEFRGPLSDVGGISNNNNSIYGHELEAKVS